jgi:hypothetical protein
MRFERKSIRIYVFFLVLFVLSGCQGFAKYVSQVDPLADTDLSMAYIFGKFCLTENSSDKLDIALNVSDENGENPHHIRFIKDSRQFIYAVSIEPGTYRIKEVLFTDFLKEIMGKKDFAANDMRLMESFELKAGDLFYIGDYTGVTQVMQALNNTVSQTFLITSIEDNYDDAYTALMASNPKLEVLTPRSIFGSNEK